MRIYLKKLRKENGLTQKEIGKKLSISESHYNLIEHGKRQKYLNASFIKRLMEIFGLTADELLRMEAEYENVKEMPEPMKIKVLKIKRNPRR